MTNLGLEDSRLHKKSLLDADSGGSITAPGRGRFLVLSTCLFSLHVSCCYQRSRLILGVCTLKASIVSMSRPTASDPLSPVVNFSFTVTPNLVLHETTKLEQTLLLLPATLIALKHRPKILSIGFFFLFQTQSLATSLIPSPAR